MMKKKKLFFMLSVLVFSVQLLCGCKREEKNSYTREQLKTLNSLQKIEDKNIYSLTYYGDYDFKNYKDNVKTEALKLPDQNRECSGFFCRNSKGEMLYCRNLDLGPGSSTMDSGKDWIPMVVTTNPSKGFSSVTLVDICNLVNEGDLINFNNLTLEKKEKLLQAPFEPRDGMNEHGLAVSTIGIPESKYKNSKDAVRLGKFGITRLILDNARTVEEAEKILKGNNLAFPYDAQYFIADAAGNSLFVESTDDEIQYVSGNENWDVTTNFRHSNLTKVKELVGSGVHEDVVRYGIINRYKYISGELEKKGGILELEDCIRILQEVVPADYNAWSVVYNLNSGEVSIKSKHRYTYDVTYDRVSATH